MAAESIHFGVYRWRRPKVCLSICLFVSSGPKFVLNGFSTHETQQRLPMMMMMMMMMMMIAMMTNRARGAA